MLSGDISAGWRTSESGHSNLYLVDPGFLQVYGPENEDDARNQAISTRKEPNFLDISQPDLQQSFVETYFEYCYPWCPVLDRSTLSTDLAQSPLLDNALALVGSHVQPPMIPHAGPAAYYDRARRRFYDDEEADLITSLKAVSLFYWWSPRPPSLVHRHSSWWWTSVVIRHCQQAGLHREPKLDQSRQFEVEPGLRRRIWWTAFVGSSFPKSERAKYWHALTEEASRLNNAPSNFDAIEASAPYLVLRTLLVLNIYPSQTLPLFLLPEFLRN